MSLNKLNYVDQVTVIPASNLNDIQDAIIELEGDVGELGTEIEGKADASSVYTKTEADALLNTKANASETYTKTEVDTLVSGKADASSVYTKTEMDTALSGKADATAVYTKTETDTLLSAKASASDLDALEEEMADYKQMYLDSLIHTTASGSIASFSDGFADAPMDSCTASIEPKQEGSGDPSPTNIRPISGFTGAEVVRSGKNIFDGVFARGTFNNDGSEASSTTRLRADFIPVFQGNINISTPTTNVLINEVFRYDADKNYVSKTAPASASASVPIASGVAYVRFSVRYSNNGTIDITDGVQAQVEYGSTATAYAPYTSDTYSVSWEDEAGTVYGGSVDLVSGVLTITKGYIASYNGETLPSTWISDRDVYAEGTTPTTGAEVCYELATPTTYQLTPQEVTTLLGSNNVWADTGDTSVGYVANTKLYIDSKLS